MYDFMLILEILARILLAMVIGGLIGWEREKSNRPAGLRTHMLVTVGAAVVMIIGELSALQYAGVTTIDPTRLGAQVISGIGFLGAGTILRDGLSVRGLTTAASLWAVACLGLAVGGGYYVVAAAGALAILITLSLFDHLERNFKREKAMRIEMITRNVSDTLNALNNLAFESHGTVSDIGISQDTTDGAILHHLVFKIFIDRKHRKKEYTDFIASLSTLETVTSVKVEDI